MSCSGVFVLVDTGVAVPDTSEGSGLTSSPTALGMRAEPSAIAEKSTFMNRRIMSCVTCGTSKPAIWEALKS